jgi:hypothetical protein
LRVADYSLHDDVPISPTENQMSSADFQVSGTSKVALFTLKLHRGDGMCLVAMNWKKGKPPANFVGFAIESRPPDFKGVLSAQQPRRVSGQ